MRGDFKGALSAARSGLEIQSRILDEGARLLAEDDGGREHGCRLDHDHSGHTAPVQHEPEGEGYVGFFHAFLQTGARSLLVSLWKVEDRAASILMQRFYENLLGKGGDDARGWRTSPMGKVEALQEAKDYLRSYTDDEGRRPFKHPYFWAAFILLADRT